MKYCPYCGGQLASTAVKCHACQQWLDLTKRPPWAKEVDDLWSRVFASTRNLQAAGGAPSRERLSELGSEVYDYVATQIERGAAPPWMWRDPSPELRSSMQAAGLAVPTATPSPAPVVSMPVAPQAAPMAPVPTAPQPAPVLSTPFATPAAAPTAPVPAGPGPARWQPPPGGGWNPPPASPTPPVAAEPMRGGTQPGGSPSPLLHPPGAMPSAPAMSPAAMPPAPAMQPAFSGSAAPPGAPHSHDPAATAATAQVPPVGRWAPGGTQPPMAAQAPIRPVAASMPAPTPMTASPMAAPPMAAPPAAPASRHGLAESPRGLAESPRGPTPMIGEGPGAISIDRLQPGKPTKPRSRSFTREFLGETFVEQAEMAEAAAAAGAAAGESGEFDSTFGDAVSSKSSIPWKWVVVALVVAGATGGAIVLFAG